MEDKRRILELVREGALTPEEALELLSALEEAPQGPSPKGGGDAFPEGAPLFRVEASGAEVWLEGVPGLEAPRVQGEGAWADGVYRVLGGEGRLYLPEGSRVEVQALGSNLSLKGVHLLGQALGSNLEGEGLLGLDLVLKGGNLEAGLLLKEGEHRLRLLGGNAELRFLPGSDLRLEAQVFLGALEVQGLAQQGPGVWVLGQGRARLALRVRMGNAELEA